MQCVISLARKQRAQKITPFDQRRAAQVVAVKVGQIKYEILYIFHAPAVEGILQFLKTRHAIFIQHHDFAIEPSLFRVDALQGLRQ